MLNRTSAPTFSKTFSFELPQPQIIQLNEGLDFIYLSGLQQEVFKLEFVFKAGKWWETKNAVSHFTAIMLEKGTAAKSSSEIANQFDYYGAQIEISPGYDYTSVSLYGLKKYFDQIFPLFWEILSKPSFNQAEFDLQKDIFLQNLKVNNEKNSFVASKLIRKSIFGGIHPYGNAIEESDVNDLTRQNLADFFSLQFNPCSIFLIGNFNEAQIQSLTERIQFSSSNFKDRTFEINPESQNQSVVKSESVQSSIRLGKRIVNRNHPDYFSLLLLNHILGGYFGSRLMKNIREEKGLTYGIYSSIHPFKNDCLFSIGADVGKDKKELAIDEIKQEILQLSQQSISIEELTTAKNHFLGNLQLEVANPFSSLEKIKNLQLNSLGNNYYKNLFSAITEIDQRELQAIAQKYFTLHDLFEVSVG
jgi:predicted Zn-dependent peptidase